MKSYYSLCRVLISFIIVMLYSLAYSSIDYFSEDSLRKFSFVLCWCGVIQIMCHTYTWKKLTKGWFSIQTIFLIFCFLFNYGQCLLWAFNIHSSTEIGASLLYYKFNITSLVLCKAQLITLAIIYSLHIGMMIAYGKKNGHKLVKRKKNVERCSEQNIDIGCKLLFCAITPISFYCSIKNLILARAAGYWAIYYGNTAYSTNSILVLISMMFFTSVMGILIFCNKGALIKKMALLSFVVLSLIQFASGDRGFVYQVCILIFWYMQRKKIKIPKTKLIFFLIISYIGIGLLSAVKEIRGGHVTLSALVTVLGSAEKLPISSALLEMGGSMSPLVAIVAYGGNPYPYGNTFIFTLPGMITEHLITIFEIPYESLANWFSFEFLNLNSGAAFSIVAEIYMNFGIYGGLIFALVLGMILGKIFRIDYSTPTSELFSISTAAALISISRNTFQTGMKNFFWGVIVYYLMMYTINNIVKGKKINTKFKYKVLGEGSVYEQ